MHMTGGKAPKFVSTHSSPQARQTVRSADAQRDTLNGLLDQPPSTRPPYEASIARPARVGQSNLEKLRQSREKRARAKADFKLTALPASSPASARERLTMPRSDKVDSAASSTDRQRRIESMFADPDGAA